MYLIYVDHRDGVCVRVCRYGCAIVLVRVRVGVGVRVRVGVCVCSLPCIPEFSQ